MSMRVIAHRKGEPCVFEPECEDLRALMKDPGVHVWVDIEGTDPRAQSIFSEVLALHPLVIEDIFCERLTPKVEDYGDYLYVVVHGIDRRTKDPENLQLVELDLILGDRFVVTHHLAPMRSLESVEIELRRNPRLLSKGPAYLMHAFLDHITDHFLPLMDHFDEDVGNLEREIFADARSEQLAKIFALKNALQKIRRTAVHQKEILHRLARGEFERIDKQALPFYRDVFDHFQRVADLVDSYRELVANALEAYLGMQSQKLNAVMKVLTVISTVMLPLNFLAGVYGMNFDSLPLIHAWWGPWGAFGAMIVIAVSLLLFFRKKGWLD